MKKTVTMTSGINDAASFPSRKMPEESLSSEAEAIIACFCGKRKHVTP